MLVFCDTSAIYAVANRDDEAHAVAARMWERLIGDPSHRLVTTNYVTVETFTLTQRRRGLTAALMVAEALREAVETTFVDEALHAAAMRECSETRRRNLSLVDCTSFAFMRRNRIRTAFSFDKHFFERGFEPVRL